MTQQFAIPDDAPPHNPHYSDAFVVFSVTVLSCAIGAWLLLRLGLALWVGIGRRARRLCRAALVPPAGAPLARPQAPHRLPMPPVAASACAPPPSRATAPQPEAGRDACRRTPTAAVRLPRSRALGRGGVGREAARRGELPTPRPAIPSISGRRGSPRCRPCHASGLGASRASSSQASRGRPPPSLLGCVATRNERRVHPGPDQEARRRAQQRDDQRAPGRRPERTDETEAMIGRSVAALQTTARSDAGPARRGGSGAPRQPCGLAAKCRPRGRPDARARLGAGAPRQARRRSSIPSSRASPRPSPPSAWRSCSSRSTPSPKAGRATSRSACGC